MVELLGIEDKFEGIAFCHYGAFCQGEKMVCEPDPEMFCKVERDAAVEQNTPIYFVDDSGQNCSAAEKRGSIAVQRLEPDEKLERQMMERQMMTRRSIKSFEELKRVAPYLFKG